MSAPHQELDAFSQIVVDHVQKAFPEAIQEVIYFRQELTLVVGRDAVVDVCTYLRDDPDLAFNYMADLTGVDMLPEHPRFEVNIHLLVLHALPPASLPRGGEPGGALVEQRPTGQGTRRVRVKVRLEEHDARMPTLTGVWPSTLWYERETHELFGIAFEGHPDMRPLLLPDDWAGPPPLRRDVPVKVEEVAFSFNQKRIYANKPFAKE